MVFSSLPFLFFYLPVVLLIYKLTPLKLRNLFLLLASLFFYGWGEPVYILIMFLSTAVDYTHGMLVERWRSDDRKARLAVASSVFFNLAILVFFKYWDFIAGNVNALTGLNLPVFGIPLPIGISFYTFQTMSYTIDVYRQSAPVQRNVITFGAYVTLFPQLIAGPIIQYKTVAEQLVSRTENLEKFVSGVRRFIVGLAKKVLLANAIGELWDQALASQSLTVAGAWLGLAAYAFQIYFDFSGYSDMAIGLGRMLGFEFIENFNYPYISPGSGSTSTSPWGATGCPGGSGCGISSSSGSSPDCGTGPGGTSCSGACITLCSCWRSGCFWGNGWRSCPGPSSTSTPSLWSSSAGPSLPWRIWGGWGRTSPPASAARLWPPPPTATT